MEQRGRRLLAACGALAVIYAIVVLAFVATSPDLRLRCLLVDDRSHSADPRGVRIQATDDLQFRGRVKPEPGDWLLRVGERRTHTFSDFAEQMVKLRRLAVPPGWNVDRGFDPSDLHESEMPWVFEENETESRWVRVEFRPRDSASSETTWLLMQSVPLGEVVLTLVWLVLQLGIFVVAALAYWYRPLDRPARLFFAMCLVTLVAFVGGYHWWVIAGTLWLTAPFVVCAVLLPAVALHFFLVYPRPKFWMSRRPGLTVAVVYAAPILAIASLLGTIVSTSLVSQTSQVEQALWLIRQEINAYLGVAALYFVLSLVALASSDSSSRNVIEHNQVRWILRAGLIAAIPVSYTLYLAVVDRVGFALDGRARLPMFLASLSFMLAYAVGIVRYKLMLVDQILGKGLLYYVVSGGLTICFSLTIALGSMLDQLLGFSLSPQQVLAMAVILMLAVVLLLWFRDLLQQAIDRRFFREKYQLDRALRRMNRAVGHSVTPAGLAEMMLGSCRDVLRVERAALYLRTSPKKPFQLVAAEGAENVPREFAAETAFLETLHQSGSLQRVTPGTRSEMSPIQNQLRALQADLVHALEVSDGVQGLVVLGEKKNGATFTAEDLTFLNALGQITNVALHSAKIHQDVERLNEELRQKSEKIADQKRQMATLQSELTGTQGGAALASAEAVPFRREALKGNSPAIQRVLDTVRKVATSESSVLIRGESGTGKELLAQVLHDNSPRSSGPMIRVHCASLSPSLLESELFGHVKGAFTGAYQDRVGRFEAANGGTLFLDEIGDISLETQIKLLRVLQERSFEPVGGTRTIQVDVRLTTATHQNLERLIAKGRFREDLYYRLNVISITLPPLRERREDIFELALYFLNRSARRVGKRITHIDEDALAALEQYGWPGNIRELENAIERAVVLAEDEQISLHDLPADIERPVPVLPGHVLKTEPSAVEPARVGSEVNGSETPFHDNRAERELLADALRRCDGNKAKAARMLGLPRSTYFSKLRKYAIK